jgi:hypothetical protein
VLVSEVEMHNVHKVLVQLITRIQRSVTLEHKLLYRLKTLKQQLPNTQHYQASTTSFVVFQAFSSRIVKNFRIQAIV